MRLEIESIGIKDLETASKRMPRGVLFVNKKKLEELILKDPACRDQPGISRGSCPDTEPHGCCRAPLQDRWEKCGFSGRCRNDADGRTETDEIFAEHGGSDLESLVEQMGGLAFPDAPRVQYAG